MTTEISTPSNSNGGGSFSLLHQGVQRAIFQLGWTKLHYIQKECIETILCGTEHLLVCAQTAGGKTEAAFLPIISKLAENPKPSVQALYVGPLVALINDQFQRLEKLCGYVEVPVHRWHGGASATEKRRLRDAPGGILLITPESLESNFVNYSNHLQRIYADLDFIVIDELHSFLSNVRGIHLRSLLARLSSATGRKPRMIGLSATLGNPTNARTFLTPNEPDSVKIIEDSTMQRSVQFGIKAYLSGVYTEDEKTVYRIQPAATLSLVEDLSEEQIQHSLPLDKVSFRGSSRENTRDELDDVADDILRTCGDKTNLVFANAKQGLEILADRLHEAVREMRWPYDPFHVHHGSLSRDLRDDVEAILKRGAHATVLCSSTLEMGIDIGSVRRVAQLDPPWSVSSMIQRLGRSGRRDGESAIMRIYSRDDSPHSRSSIADLLFPHLLRAVAMARLMFSKWLEPSDLGRLNLSTLVHQILSCLRQTGGVKATDLYNTLSAKGAFHQVSPQIFARVLRSLAANYLIEQMPQGELILAPDGERITEARDFYAAFAASDEFIVRSDGEDIGKLPASLIPPIGENLILGGRRWCVTEIDTRLKIIFVVPTNNRKKPFFSGTGGELHNRIMEEMSAVLTSNDDPIYLDMPAKTLLRAARKFAQRTGAVNPGFIVRKNSIQWFPWIGSRGFLTLQLHARCDDLKIDTDALSITYKNLNFEQWHAHLKTIAANGRTALQLARLMYQKTFDKFDDALFEDLLDEANAHDRIDLNSAVNSAIKTLSELARK